jgi:sRNA-binding regulator protein Hfq
MAYNEYLNDAQYKKIPVKVFLDNKTMLSGLVVDFDNNVIILDKCLINIDKIISIDHEKK